nr:alpha/beta hydrolase fold domain-containing protein [Alteribacillus sp. YIM 98480]
MESHDGLCRAIIYAAEFVTISVDYRLAPEYKFPAAVKNTYAVAEYVYQHAEDFKADKSKIAVGGDSAGGNSAAVVTHLAKI